MCLFHLLSFIVGVGFVGIGLLVKPLLLNSAGVHVSALRLVGIGPKSLLGFHTSSTVGPAVG